MAQNFANVFPEGLSSLHQADPEVFSIIKDEEERQWCAMQWCKFFIGMAVAGQAVRPCSSRIRRHWMSTSFPKALIL